jgi:hypothetical protein
MITILTGQVPEPETAASAEVVRRWWAASVPPVSQASTYHRCEFFFFVNFWVIFV